MTATLLPNAKTQFFDQNGKPLAGGSVYFYIPNTTTPKSTWQDQAQTILNTNPVILDGAGRAIIWGQGTYRQIVYDQFSNLVWDQITEDSTSGLLGNMTDNVYLSGADFTPGVTTALSISTAPASSSNMWVFFDGFFQTSDNYTVSSSTVTFNSPIPVGVHEVTIKVGSTIAIGAPGAATVTDSSVAPNAGIQSSKLSYNQGSPGAVTRTVKSRLQDVVSVKDFGAIGDGVADDTAAVSNFFNAIQNGGYGFIPDGTYNITNGVVVNKPITLFGGQNAVLNNTNPSLVIPIIHILASGSRYTTLDGFSISSVALTGGTPAVAGVQVDGGGQFILRDLNIRGTQRGVFISAQTTGAVVDGCYVSGTSNDGYLIFDGNLSLTDCYAVFCSGVGFNFTTSVGSAGITMDSCTSFNNTGGNFKFQGSPSAAMQDVFLSNLVASACKNNPNYLFDTFGKNIQLTGVFSELGGCDLAGTPISASPGIHFTANNHRVTIGGGQSTGCGGPGMKIECSYFSVTGGDYTSNSTFSYGSYPGVLVAPSAAVSNFSIVGINTVPAPVLDNNSQGWGISFGVNNNSMGTITSCVLSGTVAPINIPSPSSIQVSANAGYINEASGRGVMTAGTTALSITHGMNVTPSIVTASIIDGTGSANLSLLVGTPNSSGFTIYMNTTSGSNVDICWYARQ